MHRPPDIPTPEQKREKLRDTNFRIGVASVIKKYFPEIPKWTRYDIATKTLELVKEAEEADDV
jgi:hypothetical protein